MLRFGLILALLIELCFAPAYANRIYEAIRSILTVHPLSVKETVVKLRDARVVVADYDLIRHDFPKLSHLNNSQIDNYLLMHAGYISEAQAAQSIVNTPIATEDIRRPAYRPPKHGRSLVFELLDPINFLEVIGLIDSKGSGAVDPQQKHHSNGLATLGECLREFAYERLMREVLAHADSFHKTVGSYAVIDLGFDVVHADGSRSPAGAYFRQAHQRGARTSGFLSDFVITMLTKILHGYGIEPNGNIQGTIDGHIFDYGHYVTHDDLPGIDPDKQVPFEQWGYDKSIERPRHSSRWFFSKVDHPWMRFHALADAWREGHANRHDVWMMLESMLNPVREKLGHPYDRAQMNWRHNCLRKNLSGN